MNSLAHQAPGVKSPSRNTTPQPFEFHPCPKEILRRKDLSDAGKILFGVLLNDARFRQGGRASKASNDWLADETGFDVQKVKRILKELELAGLVGRAFKQSKQVQRTSIEITWIPAVDAGESVISIGVSNLNPQPESQVPGIKSEPLGGLNMTRPGIKSDPPGVSNLTRIKEEKREESERRPAPPSPTRTRSEPSSPGDEDGTGLPAHINLVGLGPDSIRRAIESGIDQAARIAPASQGESAEGGGVFGRSRIPRALRDARGASRGPARKMTADELRAQVETLRKRSTP